MENMSLENFVLCFAVLGKIAYNFWPAIVVFAILSIAENYRDVINKKYGDTK